MSENKVVPVLVNRESRIQIPTRRGEKGYIPSDAIIFLEPGWNLVAKELWDDALKNSVVQELFKTKIPKATAPEMNPEKVGQLVLIAMPPVDADNPLNSLDEDEQIQFIEETFQIPLLRKMADQAQHASVQRAIREKISSIEEPKARARADRERRATV